MLFQHKHLLYFPATATLVKHHALAAPLQPPLHPLQPPTHHKQLHPRGLQQHREGSAPLTVEGGSWRPGTTNRSNSGIPKPGNVFMGKHPSPLFLAFGADLQLLCPHAESKPPQ